MPNQPNIYDYTDYRGYLSAMTQYLKQTQPVFSYRYFAKQAGFKSPNFLMLVAAGKRNLTQESIPKFIKAFKLKGHEAKYFECLVQFNQAEHAEEKNQHYQQMTQQRRYREIRHVENQQYRFYSRWYHSAIRELVTHSHFIEDPVWIAKALVPTITAKQAEQSLKLLLKLNLLKRNSRGRLVQADATITSGAEVKSLAVANYHREMIKRAGDAIALAPATDRDISSVTIGLREEEMPQLKAKIDRFRKELLASLGGHSVTSERVYQMNIQLFPLTRKPAGGRS